MSNAPWRLGAVDLAARIARREITCRQATASVLERIAQHNGRINAIVDLMAADALAVADQADRRQDRGDPIGPLHGVPITIKVNVDTAGRANTDGVVACRDDIAQTDRKSVV